MVQLRAGRARQCVGGLNRTGTTRTTGATGTTGCTGTNGTNGTTGTTEKGSRRNRRPPVAPGWIKYPDSLSTSRQASWESKRSAPTCSWKRVH